MVDGSSYYFPSIGCWTGTVSAEILEKVKKTKLMKKSVCNVLKMPFLHPGDIEEVLSAGLPLGAEMKGHYLRALV